MNPQQKRLSLGVLEGHARVDHAGVIHCTGHPARVRARPEGNKLQRGRDKFCTEHIWTSNMPKIITDICTCTYVVGNNYDGARGL